MYEYAHLVDAVILLFRKYCVNCLNIWTEQGDKLVNNADEWLCFLCLSDTKMLLQAHDNWEQQVLILVFL